MYEVYIDFIYQGFESIEYYTWSEAVIYLTLPYLTLP